MQVQPGVVSTELVPTMDRDAKAVVYESAEGVDCCHEQEVNIESWQGVNSRLLNVDHVDRGPRRSLTRQLPAFLDDSFYEEPVFSSCHQFRVTLAHSGEQRREIGQGHFFDSLPRMRSQSAMGSLLTRATQTIKLRPDMPSTPAMPWDQS